MSAEEIESYKFQLEQVELALQSDPSNEELTKLQHDLKELINMFEAASSASQTDSSPVKKKQHQPVPEPTTAATALKHHEFSIDQEVLARWSGDGEFYKATITAIGGADQVFSVKFKGYNEAEFVKAEDIKPIQDKRKRAGVFENVEGPKKKKSSTTATAPTPSVPKKKKAVEFENKKNAWLNFATGSTKKTKTKAPTVINKKSIFKTPDNPEGKGKLFYFLRVKYTNVYV